MKTARKIFGLVLEKIRVASARKLTGVKASTIRAFRLDGTTLQNSEAANTTNVIYSIDSIDDVPSDLILNLYGMALLTNDIKKINQE
jgi:hypothetical protein